MYGFKVRAMLGHGERGDRAIVILGRQTRWFKYQVEVKEDERLSKTIRSDTGIKGESTELSAPAKRAEGHEGDEGVELERKEAYEYKGSTARANYMGLDKPDVQFAVKETC